MEIEVNFLDGSKRVYIGLFDKKIKEANFSKSDLTLQNISRSEFVNSDFSYSRFKESSLRFSNFNKCNFIMSDFRSSNMAFSSFSYCDFSRANLCGAYLFDSELIGCDFRCADFSKANLSRSDLYGSNLSSSNLSGANLSFCKNIISLNLGRHVAVYYFYKNHRMKIGCLDFPIETWVRQFKSIGRSNNYSDDEIQIYGDFIKLCSQYEITGD